MAEDLSGLGYEVHQIPTILSGPRELFPNLYGRTDIKTSNRERTSKHPHFIPANGILIPSGKEKPFFVTMGSIRPLDDLVAESLKDLVEVVRLESLVWTSVSLGSLRCMCLSLPRGFIDLKMVNTAL